jgi:hypothetical protein
MHFATVRSILHRSFGKWAGVAVHCPMKRHAAAADAVSPVASPCVWPNEWQSEDAVFVLFSRLPTPSNVAPGVARV